MRCSQKNILAGLACIMTLFPSLVWGQTLRLNEVVSSNQASLSDEDGDSPDWIEIYNPSVSEVDLQGYALSDDVEDPLKWRFETGQVAGGEHVLVFASDKDRQGLNIFYDLIISWNAIWSYFVGSTNPPSDWQSPTFNDTQWLSGPSGFGYGDDDDNTVIPTTLSVFLRKSFTVVDTSALAEVLFHIDYDDGYIAYINGVEFSRANLGAPGSVATNTTPADTYTEPALPQGFDLPFHIIPHHLLRNGDNVIAVQVHNHSTSSSDLTALPFISFGASNPPGNPLPDYLTRPDQPLFHTNFKVSSNGELVLLSSPEGTIIDSFTTPSLPADISWGREPDASDQLYYFNPSTPGEPNVGGFTSLGAPIEVSPVPGFYGAAVPFSLGSVPDGRVYKYTLDGTKPNLSSPSYSSTLYFTETTVVRVMNSTLDGTNAIHTAYSYFINENRYLPVMSLIFEPGSFFDNDTGMYVLGSNASESFPHFGANFWEDWERQIHLEYFETGEDLTYSADAGAKIFGGWSRGNAQRSLSLFARSRYGTGKFDFPFFPELDVDTFEALVLRNSGNDWNASGYRDGFMTGLVDNRDIDKQAFQPVEVYFNGDYWGIYNLREKVNEHFVASHHHIDTDDIDLLAIDGSEVVHGDNSEYMSLINYVNTHALVSDLDFEYIRDRVDVQNFIDYQLSQIYFDNQDWPGNNIKFWRSRLPGGKWRWVLYDTDFGFSIWSNNNYMRNTLEFATDPNGPGWPNPPWSTLLLRKFLENPGFKREFILTACDLMNQAFTYETVESALNRHQQWLLLSLSDHFTRWHHNSTVNWYHEGEVMDDFAELRPAYVRNHFRGKFNLGSDSEITLHVSPTDAGQIRVHSIIPESYPWVGTYFSDVPLDVRAIALPGYQFSHWSGIPGEDPDLTVSLLNPSTQLTAVFEPVSPDDGALVINEINYHSADDSDCKDWVELFNGTQSSIELENWSISDDSDDNLFLLPEITLLPDAYLVVSSDSVAFKTIHGEGIRLAGDLDFNFSNGGELIRLFNSDNILMDSVRYDDSDPWPTSPDGDGPTLELTHPLLDNSLSTNWSASDNQGTPGFQNSRYLEPAGLAGSHQPENFQLGMAYPNPFNASIRIPFTVLDAASFQITIYDLLGRQVLSESFDSPSQHKGVYQWNGTDATGKDCSSGMYVINLTQKGFSASSKIALLR